MGVQKSEEQRTFRGAADKGGAEKALGSWEVPRSRRRHWGEGGEEGSLGQWPGVPQGPCLGFRGALGIPTPPPLDSPNPPSTKDTAWPRPCPSASCPDWGMTWCRRCLPVACAAASLLSSARLSRAPGPGSEEPAAAPAPRWRWQHPRGPVRSRQPPPPPPPARGNTGHCPAEWGWGPRGAGLGLPLSGCGFLRGLVPALLCAARRSLLPALARSSARPLTLSPAP